MLRGFRLEALGNHIAIDIQHLSFESDNHVIDNDAFRIQPRDEDINWSPIAMCSTLHFSLNTEFLGD